MSDEIPEQDEVETEAAEAPSDVPEADADMASQIAADHEAAVAEAMVEADPELVDEAVVAEGQADAQIEAEAAADADEADEAELAAEASDEAIAEGIVAAADEPETAQPTRTVPTRRRDRKRDPNEPKPVVRAQAKYVRSSARKARLVCDNFRGKTVEEARAILAVTPRHVARDWSKLLESAVANAEHNHELVGEDLIVKAVQADEGPTIKRFRPRAQGRATRIRKRTSHLTILLTPKD
jgi:ribosomal protein L22